MKEFAAFTKKEILASFRTGKTMLLLILFFLFGIMNPAVAKLTPWLIQAMAGDFSRMGLSFSETEISVDALTSWAQFYKNIPVALIVFLLVFCNILTGEYQEGTLIHMVTKGMNRWKILLSKEMILAVFWTGAYWLSYSVTYGYNAYFWDNRIAAHPVFAAFCFYLFGIWMISLLLFLSAICNSNSQVLLSMGGIFCAVYLAGTFSKIKKYLPVHLLDSSKLLSGADGETYFYAVGITAVLVLVDIVLAVVCFDKRSL